MAVHDGEKFLQQALEGILGQTYKDLEFIIVDDGSTDSTGRILQEYARRDSRIISLHNQEHSGLTRSLNKGLEFARGEYLARQDADDFSMRERLEAQVNFLDENPQIGLLGTAYHLVDHCGRILKTRRPPQTDTAIRWHMIFSNPFCHSSVMLRRCLTEHMEIRYDNRWQMAQDYELWSRVLQYTRGANLSLPLVCLRVHQSQVSQRYKQSQEAAAENITAKSLEKLCGRAFSQEEIRVLRNLFDSFPKKLSKQETWRLALLLEVIEHFEKQMDISQADFSRIRALWFARIMSLAPQMGRQGLPWKSCARLSLKHPMALPRALGYRLWEKVLGSLYKGTGG